MNVNDILTFNTQVLFITLALVALVDYARRRGARRRDFFLFALALGYPLGISFVRRFISLQSTFLDVTGAFALFSQPYFLFRLLQYFRPSRTRVAVLILAGFALCCILLLTGLNPTRVTIIFSYCAAAEAYSTWGFYQHRRDTSGTLRSRLTIIMVSSGVFSIAFLISALKAQIPNFFIVPFGQVAAAISAVLFYAAFIPPRWLRRAWQMQELHDYLAQGRIAPTHDHFIAEQLRQLSQRANQITGGNVAGIVRMGEAPRKWTIPVATDRDSLVRLVEIDPPFIKEVWDSGAASYHFVADIADPNQRRQLEALGARTWLLVPIQNSKQLWAVLVVALGDRSLFIDDDLDILKLLAQECSLILDNHRLIEELQDSLEQLERKVEERTVALQRSNDELRNYAYVASHDLQEPLRMVTSYLELIKMRFPDKLDQEGKEFIAFAVEGALRMKNLINDLLTYSRLETRPRNFTLVNTQEILDNAEQTMTVMVDESEAQITHDALPQIVADEALLFQVFQNLISNAIKYRSKRKLEIHIGAVKKDDIWVFSVHDNGIGIEERFLEKIFVIFQRLHTRDQYPGTGIGLAICRKAIELHHGRIWAESTLGEGTTFYFTIPVAESRELSLPNAS